MDPAWVANGFAKHRTQRGSTWVDHVRSEWHVTRTSVTWDFRGGGRTTCQGKSRGDGWDRYIEEDTSENTFDAVSARGEEIAWLLSKQTK